MPVIYTTDIFGENYLKKPQLPAEVEEINTKMEEAINKLPYALKVLIGSYARSFLLINQSKEKELSNLQLNQLKEYMTAICVLAEKYQESSKQL